MIRKKILNWDKLIAGAFILIFSVLVVLSQKNGQSMSGMSISYYYSAKQLSCGNGFVNCDGRWNTTYMPFYSSLLSGLHKLGLSISKAGILINLACYISFLSLIWVWSRQILKSQKYALIVLFLAGSSFELFRVFVTAHTESIFLTLILFCAYFMSKYYKNLSRGNLLAAMLFLCLSWLTRYIGAYMVGVCGLIIIAASISHKKYLRLTDLSFLLIAIVPVGVWLYRNLSKTGSLFGTRPPSITTFFENLNRFCITSANSFLGDANRILHINTIMFVLGLCFLGWIVIVQIKCYINWKNEEYTPGLILTTMATVYAALILYTSSKYQLDSLEGRLCLPFLVPASFSVFIVMCKKAMKAQQSFKIFLIVVFIGLFFVGTSRICYGVIHRMKGHSLGCNSLSLKDYRQVAEYVDEMGDTIFSNNNEFCSYALGAEVHTTSELKLIKKIPEKSTLVIFKQDLKISPPFFCDTTYDIDESLWQIKVKTPRFIICELKTASD